MSQKLNWIRDILPALKPDGVLVANRKFENGESFEIQLPDNLENPMDALEMNVFSDDPTRNLSLKRLFGFYVHNQTEIQEFGGHELIATYGPKKKAKTVWEYIMENPDKDIPTKFTFEERAVDGAMKSFLEKPDTGDLRKEIYAAKGIDVSQEYFPAIYCRKPEDPLLSRDPANWAVIEKSLVSFE